MTDEGILDEYGLGSDSQIVPSSDIFELLVQFNRACIALNRQQRIELFGTIEERNGVFTERQVDLMYYILKGKNGKLSALKLVDDDHLMITYRQIVKSFEILDFNGQRILIALLNKLREVSDEFPLK